jgi:hypothetical protein
MDDRHKFVVQLSIEGFMVGTWLTSKPGGNIETLDDAELFDTVVQAHEAMTPLLRDGWPGLLGYAIKFRGLCQPNPC